jgi:hypothetical protein
VDLSDIAARELHEHRIPLIGSVGSDQNFHTNRFGLGKRLREIRHFISCPLPAVMIWKVTVR